MSARNAVIKRLQKIANHNIVESIDEIANGVDESLDFIRAFLENPLHVGSISPSSPELAEAMVEGIFPDEENVVLEIGVGTGAITKFLEKRLSSPKSYVGIELNEKFVKILHKKFPKLLIVQGDARHTTEVLKKVGIEKVRYIISGLPFASLPKFVRREILGEIDKLMTKECLFRTFQYAHCYYLASAVEFRRYMNLRYGRCEKSRIVLKNIPPAFTLTWEMK